jgi:hypothetical protein
MPWIYDVPKILFVREKMLERGGELKAVIVGVGRPLG